MSRRPESPARQPDADREGNVGHPDLWCPAHAHPLSNDTGDARTIRPSQNHKARMRSKARRRTSADAHLSSRQYTVTGGFPGNRPLSQGCSPTLLARNCDGGTTTGRVSHEKCDGALLCGDHRRTSLRRTGSVFAGVALRKRADRRLSVLALRKNLRSSAVLPCRMRYCSRRGIPTHPPRASFLPLAARESQAIC